MTVFPRLVVVCATLYNAMYMIPGAVPTGSTGQSL